MRPGRLDRILFVGAPDFATRKDIFRINLARMAVEPGADLDELARIVSDVFGHRISSVGSCAAC